MMKSLLAESTPEGAVRNGSSQLIIIKAEVVCIIYFKEFAITS